MKPTKLMTSKGSSTTDNAGAFPGITRRNFLKYSTGAVATLYLGPLAGCGGGGTAQVPGYPIDSTVVKTTTRMLSFPMPPKLNSPNSGTGLCPTELCRVSQYQVYGYGTHSFGAPLPMVQRTDIMPDGYSNADPVRLKKFAHFFAMTDIHITDKEAPNQLIYIQQEDPVFGGPGTSLYSPVMLYTTHVLDAAIQTVNALHRQTPFDFGISLGDACNSSQYNELRWYIDVLDGKVITPSSGAHLGSTSIDYQKPFKAAGLDRSIPWYQVLGNHDHFWLGSIPIDADPTLKIRESYTSSKVWALGDLLIPNSLATFPCLMNATLSMKSQSFYMGVLDGSTPEGDIKGAGAVASVAPPPTVAADPDRRPLLRTEWMQEFFNTATLPAGHGMNLIDPSMGSGFACYSFFPVPGVPLKMIVLDNTQSETDGSHDIHGHGFLDATRWHWLQTELAAGQANDHLMIIAAHIPIGVTAIGSEMEWWQSDKDPNATIQNAVGFQELVTTLQDSTNLIAWIAGHRHFNTIKAFVSPDRNNQPEKGFWQIETSSLRDFPQQFRTFEVYLNHDYTISIATTNVDPAVAEGTPAAVSRTYAIAAQQIIQADLRKNVPNAPSLTIGGQTFALDSMDPSRPQDGTVDPTITYPNVAGVPYCASVNAELFKQLSPAMVTALKARFA